MALTPKQAAFVREYLVDLNATQAAIRVGYSPRSAKVQGSRLLTNADIRAAVDAAKERATETADVTVAEIVEGLMSEARGADVAGARVQAWGILAKYKKMLTDKVEMGGADGGPLQVSINISGVRK